MHPREKVLQKVELLKQRGELIPLDVLAEADRWGLLIDAVGEMPRRNKDGKQSTKKRLHDPKGSRSSILT